MTRFRKRLLGALLGAATGLAIGGGAAWCVAPYCVDDPMTALARQTPVRVWTDREGRPLWLERTWDAQWRFPVPLERISPHAIRVVIAAEDANFYRHGGVDYSAVCRAAWQNLTSLRRISGASTIPMQLSGMALPPGPHDWKRKFLQAAMARKLVRRHSRDEILAEYLNHVPFGGKLRGIEAAARYYFGRPAAQLNLAEATLLCGLPQRPNYLRPDRHPERARKRQRVVLKLLRRRNRITAAEAERIQSREPLRYRDFREPSPFRALASPGELGPAFAAAGTDPRTTIDAELHFRTLALLRHRRSLLRGVRDAAAVLIDNRTGQVPVYIGTLDHSAGDGGEVDAVRAVRSAGSSLKPFIYAEAAAAGWLTAATRISDAPVRYGTYAPGNYDGKFHGPVRAGYALSHSLNTPAVRLTARLGEDRTREAFVKLGLLPDDDRKTSGLSLALGTAGHTLWAITRAYATLASGGIRRDATLHRNPPRRPTEQRIFTPALSALISAMLRERRLPGCSVDVAWKTGTSNNNCDAWCFAYTPDYTLGIWFGNKDGSRSADLVGATAAVPVAGAVFDLLYRDRPGPRWPDGELELRELCAATGLTPGPFCTRRERDWAIPGLPLELCRRCDPQNLPPLRIVSPVPLDYRTAPGQRFVTLKLDAGGEKVTWFLNGAPIGRDNMEYRFPADARHTLRAVADPVGPETPIRAAEVTFSVTGN